MISNKGLNSKEAFDESTATSSSVRLSGARRVKEKDIQEYRIDPGNSDEGRDQPKPPLLTLAFNAARLASRIATICFRMRAHQFAAAGQPTAPADCSEILKLARSPTCSSL